MIKKLIVSSILVVFIIGVFFPLYIMFRISLSIPQDIFTDKPSYLIKNFTLRHFKRLISSKEAFLLPLKKSLITALSVSILAVLISIPAAYAISRLNITIRYTLILIIFMTRMMPEVSIALPIAISFIKMGLFDTNLGLILAHLIRSLPVSCFILVGIFSSIPTQLERQAYVDGCSPIKALKKVVLPLSLRGVLVAAIFSFLFSWDEFIYASYLCLRKPTMPLKVYYYISRGDIFYSSTYAVIICLPVILLTYLLQRYLKTEYLTGALKG